MRKRKKEVSEEGGEKNKKTEKNKERGLSSHTSLSLCPSPTLLRAAVLALLVRREADEPAARRFLAEIDSATVYWNASTRFTDGFEFGYGAEIGISTDRLHARGPMGLRELCTYKFVIEGTGQVRA